MSSLEEAIRNTVTSYIKSYVDAGQAKDPSLVSRHVSPTCKRHIHPPHMLVAMGAPPELSMTNEEYEATFRGFASASVDSYEVHNMTVDASNKKAACWSVLRGKFVDGEEYERRHSWFFEMSEDGGLIEELVNVSDAAQALEYQKKLRELESGLKDVKHPSGWHICQ